MTLRRTIMRLEDLGAHLYIPMTERYIRAYAITLLEVFNHDRN